MVTAACLWLFSAIPSAAAVCMIEMPPESPQAEEGTRSPVPASTSQQNALEQARKLDLDLYHQRSMDFMDTVRASLDYYRRTGRERIDQRYRDLIRTEDALHRKALLSAIGYFERFLQKYPDDFPQTPDAMFRLAELYYDASYLIYLDYSDEFGLAQDQGRADDMPLPEKDFGRSIALFQDLIQRYPTYENIDGAYYLLGYCLKETGRLQEARMAWLNLVCANQYTYDRTQYPSPKAGKGDTADYPSASLVTSASGDADGTAFINPYRECTPVVNNSRFSFEAWLLIGEYHFDFDTSRRGVETAISAYENLVGKEDHPLYGQGLYKLAWSYYKVDRYPEAVRTFAEVVNYADRKGVGSVDMRPEAIQYLAVCFYTDDWDGDMVPDRDAGLPRLQNPAYLNPEWPWIREVYERVGDIYADNEQHDEAITVWRLFLEKWPLDRQAPFVQNKIADSYRITRRFDEELLARSRLDDFGRESAWWQDNADHPEIQSQVERMAQDALISSALTHHQQAQALRAQGRTSQDPEILGFALEEYRLAAVAYRRYLEQNPDSPNAYELNYYLAEALFWSENYAEARNEYEKVRESNLDNKYREVSAKMVIFSLERLLDLEVEAGRVVLRESPPPLAGDTRLPVAEEIPDLLMELMGERETFVCRGYGAQDSGTLAYQSAQTYYRYGHWDEATRRYSEIYSHYCKKDEISVFSWRTLLAMATERDDLDSRESLALTEQEKRCSEGLELAQDDSVPLDTLLGDVAMQRAMILFGECASSKDMALCSDAGDALVSAVSRAPDHPSADAALHNGALAYEYAQRNKTAMELYGRIVEEYPQSRWVDKCLFKQAFSANEFFEYEKALQTYRMLADQKRFADSEYRSDAIMNTAMILTNLQDYRSAVTYWNSYARIAEGVAAIEASFNAADMLYRAGDWRGAVSAYDAFIKRFRKVEDAGPYLVKASYRTGLSHRNRKQTRDEQKTWATTIALYNETSNEPGSMSAEYAAESHFLQVETEMKPLERFSISGSMEAIAKQREQGVAQVERLASRYREVQAYRRPVWSLAAVFRTGYIVEVLAKAILDIKQPPLDKEIEKQLRLLDPEDRKMILMEVEDRFRDALEQFVAPLEQQAKETYRLAVDMARQGNISNEWSLLALERLNAHDPANYPRQHNGVLAVERTAVSVPPWAAEVKP